MKTYTKEQLEKLPKWAQKAFKEHEVETNVMASTIQYLKDKLAQYEGQQETNTLLLDGLSQTSLPKNAHVRFVLPNGEITAYITQYGELNINTTPRYNYCIGAFPRASNALDLSFVKK